MYPSGENPHPFARFGSYIGVIVTAAAEIKHQKKSAP